LRGSFVLNETVTLLWLGQERVAYHFENFGRLEKSIEVFAVYDSLRIKNYILFICLVGYFVKNILLIEFRILQLF
jgi:hypothetical protein